MSSIYELVRGDRKVYRLVYKVGGKEKRKQFPTKRAARLFQERLSVHVEAEKRTQSEQNSPTVNQFCDEWLAACTRGKDGAAPLEIETVKTYSQHVAHYIAPILGAKRLAALKTGDIREFREELLDRAPSRAMAKKVFKTFKGVLRYAVAVEQLPGEPGSRVTIKDNGRVARKRITIHTKDEMRRIIDQAAELSLSENKRTRRTWVRYLPFLHLLVYCGLRLSEVRGLARESVDLVDGTVRVVQRADREGRIGHPKSARSVRKLFVPQVTIETLGQLMGSHNHSLVFCTDEGKPLNPQNVIKRMWFEVQRKAGVRRLNLHSTRHFFASRLIESGVNVKEVASALGHADEAFTLRTYGHLFTDQDNEDKRRARVEGLVLQARSR